MTMKAMVGLGLLTAMTVMSGAVAQSESAAPGEAGAPYANMNHIAPIGVRTGKYLDIPASAKGPAIDPAKGYRVERLAQNLYMITDNGYQSLFLVYETGAVLVDVPPPFAQHIKAAVREVTDAAFDVYIWDQCYSMEQSLRIE